MKHIQFTEKENDITNFECIEDQPSKTIGEIFRHLSDDDIKNLIQVNFDLNNEEPKKDELDKYNVISVVKLLNKNSVPVKFILIDPENKDNKSEMTAQDFAKRYEDVFKNFKEALNQFEKIQD